MTRQTGGQDREVGRMDGRAAVWVAWSLVALSVAFVVGGFILARTTQSAGPALPYGGADEGAILTFVTILAFSVVGAVIVSSRPRNPKGWIFSAVGLVRALDTLARGYAEYWITGGWAHGGSARWQRGSPRGRGSCLGALPPRSCCCCSPTVGFPPRAGGPWLGVRGSVSPACPWASRWAPGRSKISRRSRTPSAWTAP